MFLICLMNHCVGLFYRQKDACGYVFDSENCWPNNELLRQKLAELEKMMSIRAIRCAYQARVDFCGSQVAAATIKLIAWHHRNHIPDEIRPSPATRKWLETFFHKEPSARATAVDLATCARSKRIRCHICGKLFLRRGSYQHFANCKGPV